MINSLINFLIHWSDLLIGRIGRIPGRNIIRSARIPWVTLKNPFHSEPQSMDYTIRFDCLIHILATPWGKAACLIY